MTRGRNNYLMRSSESRSFLAVVCIWPLLFLVGCASEARTEGASEARTDSRVCLDIGSLEQLWSSNGIFWAELRVFERTSDPDADSTVIFVTSEPGLRVFSISEDGDSQSTSWTFKKSDAVYGGLSSSPLELPSEIFPVPSASDIVDAIVRAAKTSCEQGNAIDEGGGRVRFRTPISPVGLLEGAFVFGQSERAAPGGGSWREAFDRLPKVRFEDIRSTGVFADNPVSTTNP
jgi:hypothetical protein